MKSIKPVVYTIISNNVRDGFRRKYKWNNFIVNVIWHEVRIEADLTISFVWHEIKNGIHRKRYE